MNERRNANKVRIDESVDETEPLLDEQEQKLWNAFQNTPQKVESGSMAPSTVFDNGEKVIKIITYIITFVLVLGAAVISKGTLLFMTSQISITESKPYCNEELGRNQQFIVKLPDVEKVAWIWMLFFVYMIPQGFIFLRSFLKCIFKYWVMPPWYDFLIIFITESLPTIGTTMLVYCILPEIDVIKGAMLTNAVCFVPAVLGLLSCDQKCTTSVPQITLHVLSIIAQTSCFVVWPMIEDKPVLWLIPISMIFISAGWWENYISDKSSIALFRNFAKKRNKIEKYPYFIYMFVSIWKCVLFFCCMLIIFYIQEGDVSFLFNKFIRAFGEHGIYIQEIKPVYYADSGMPNITDTIIIGKGYTHITDSLTPMWVGLINVLSTYLCYIVGKFACRVLIQGFGFAFPINLAMPVTLSGLIAMCGAFYKNDCAFADTIPPYLFFDLPPVYFLKDFLQNQFAWIWLVWLLSQTWITAHIWSPTSERLARTEKLFMRPMYDPFLIDQDIALNRRRNGSRRRTAPVEKEELDMEDDRTTRIYACGTMWHETKEEMMEFLKSIMRLDYDQCVRKITKRNDHYAPDYYELETHIFFDDAFVRKKNDPEPMINTYVKDLIEAVNDAASEVHESHIELRILKKCSTPYGGKLIWLLPGKTYMVAHLKDKKKIRAKKRWSQVMYMYYLLGHRLMDIKHLSTERKELRAENTYILALDGDIDFQPKAVALLVDLMKKNKGLGAACGRIHPIGGGPMVWYQMFEYAVGHWLQKATEHIIGCVLCSPGCFSLFRAKALMDDRVMRKYTTTSSEAIHYVQYDQGEDRWLCTLLLQRGYRVEYSAASDAYTHCPEGFNEFYNQRRRWMPSTTANILDLLMNSRRTVAINDNISNMYIFYQGILMVGTVLGPGTIFLMLVGAFVAAFQMGQWTSFLWNAVPILIFMFVCKVFEKDSIQLFFAALISAIYGLVMMAVLVGVMLQISSDGWLAPSSLFFFCIAGEMIFTALLHPKELNCLKHGVVYYVTVPSMYMLLVIYSVFNMNNVSWGTRELTVLPDAAQGASTTATAPASNAKSVTMKDKVIDFIGKTKDDTGSFICSIPGFFKCMLCTGEANPVEKYQLEEIKFNVNQIMKKLDYMSKGIQEEEPTPTPVRRKTIIMEGPKAQQVQYGFSGKSVDSSVTDTTSVIEEFDDNWMDDEILQTWEAEICTHEETEFWNGLLDKYLHPIDDSKDKARISQNLRDLRDKCVAAFFMINALFVLVVFLLTLKKDLIHINWPFDIKTNFTYHTDSGQITMEKEYLQLEPIGFVFLIFFATLLIVQFLAMLKHRFATLCQILSNTEIEFNKKEEKSALDMVKQTIELEDNHEENTENVPVGKRKTVANLLKNNIKIKDSPYLEEVFDRRVTEFQAGGLKSETHRKTIAKLLNDTEFRRKSVSAGVAKELLNRQYEN